jgi:hypothetical protein
MPRAVLAVSLIALWAIPAAAEPMRLLRDTAYPDGGAGARHVQTWRGLDVLGGHRFVRRDAAGRELWAAGREAVLPERLRATPLLDAAGILAGLGRPELPPERHARLVVWAPPGRTARLAWQVVLPRDLERLQTLRLVLDADSGALLWMDDLVKRDRQARVFPSNPKASQLTVVTLDLPAGASRLAGPDFEAMNCEDQETCPLSQDATRYRWCEITALAHADGGGDFLYDRPPSDNAPEDEFAEVQMYHHATRGLGFFRSLGFAGLREQPMLAMVNLRMPDLSKATCSGATGTQALEPLENALFMPGGAIAGIFPPGDAMVFGQGEAIDFAYDGDVVYHELTHAVAAALTEMGSLAMDEHGLDASMAAMHEGFADYFSSAIAGDPRVAEYVGDHFNGPNLPLRHLEATRSCATDLVGEEHDDSELFSGALWQVRAGLPEADRARFDAAVFVVLDSLADVESFASVREKLIAEARVQLGEPGAEAARRAFADRDFDRCAERVQRLELGAAKPLLHLIGSEDVGISMPLPAVLQLEVALTKPARELRIDVARSLDGSQGGDGEARLSAIVKRGAPIVWDEDTIEHDADLVGSLMVGASGERPPVNGKVLGSFEPGTYYVQLRNAGTAWWLSDLRITTDAEGVVATDDGGCAVGGGPGGLGLVALLLLYSRLTTRAPSRSSRSRAAASTRASSFASRVTRTR